MEQEIHRNRGVVFLIQKGCIDDGPGIRTTVFLKGCPLRCKWCHNPEGISIHPIISYDATRCSGCGNCKVVCQQKCHELQVEKQPTHTFLSHACIQCGNCVAVCKTQALSYCGKQMQVDEVIKIVLADKGFYQFSGGGITLSGGEPLLQIEFATALLQRAKQEGLHTCIETSGYVPFKNIEQIAPFVDLFLYDMKETEEQRHVFYTGVSNRLILENLKKLNQLNKKIQLRCPIIPTVNDRKEHFDALVELKNQYEYCENLQLMPYHQLGQGKKARYGTLQEQVEQQEFSVPSKEVVQEWNNYINQRKEE